MNVMCATHGGISVHLKNQHKMPEKLNIKHGQNDG